MLRGYLYFVKKFQIFFVIAILLAILVIFAIFKQKNNLRDQQIRKVKWRIDREMRTKIRYVAEIFFLCLQKNLSYLFAVIYCCITILFLP